MKKKLNLLWNLKFNFFSVAERPLTLFAYFLNAKKVGRRRLVIVPATAGGLPLFPHAASVPAPALAPLGWQLTPRTPPPCGWSLSGQEIVTPPQSFGLPRFRFAQAWPLGQQPGACRRSAPFRCAKPRVRLPAPPFGFAAQNQARHFAARNHPVRLSASQP